MTHVSSAHTLFNFTSIPELIRYKHHDELKRRCEAAVKQQNVDVLEAIIYSIPDSVLTHNAVALDIMLHALAAVDFAIVPDSNLAEVLDSDCERRDYE